jgi:hypothetical protein
MTGFVFGLLVGAALGIFAALGIVDRAVRSVR